MDLAVRCMNPPCLWVGRSRPIRADVIGLGSGVFGMLRLFCECGTELELDRPRFGTAPHRPAKVKARPGALTGPVPDVPLPGL